MKTGTFAYKLEFRLQTQVGSPHRWIHLYVRCSRYVDSRLRALTEIKVPTTVVEWYSSNPHEKALS